MGRPVSRPFGERIAIDVIHDGPCVPARFLEGVPEPVLNEAYRRERDWGAELVASALASALHLRDYMRVTTARVLLDFGRFPGTTPPRAEFLDRFAINHPFSQYLDHAQKRQLLQDYYDPISSAMESTLDTALLKIAIHSYDEKNPTDTRRPAISIITRPHGHHRHFEMPVDLFDPLFPDELAVNTADRILRARLALALEENAIYVADNYPYPLPEGSIEVRSQVWCFFRWVRERFERERPLPEDAPAERRDARDLVWKMLLDTNLRSADSESLRSHLHMYRRPNPQRLQLFDIARQEYEQIASFIQADDGEIVTTYRNDLDRPSALVIEVRKDLVWDLELSRPKIDDARLVARTLAGAIQTYLTEDRPAKGEGFCLPGSALPLTNRGRTMRSVDIGLSPAQRCEEAGRDEQAKDDPARNRQRDAVDRSSVCPARRDEAGLALLLRSALRLDARGSGGVGRPRFGRLRPPTFRESRGGPPSSLSSFSTLDRRRARRRPCAGRADRGRGPGCPGHALHVARWAVRRCGGGLPLCRRSLARLRSREGERGPIQAGRRRRGDLRCRLYRRRARSPSDPLQWPGFGGGDRALLRLLERLRKPGVPTTRPWPTISDSRFPIERSITTRFEAMVRIRCWP